MTTIEFVRAKATIATACNATGLNMAELCGVLSAILNEAREQMTAELTQEVFRLTQEAKASVNTSKETNKQEVTS